MKVFWSWQSDTPGKIGRHLIKEALEEAVEILKAAPDVEEPVRELHLDQDRKGVPGSPDLARTIFSKIDASFVFVADVTTVGKVEGEEKKLINSNVAIELGYALRSLSDTNVLMVFNQHYGRHEDLPFDLRHKAGAIVFNLAPDADKTMIHAEKKKLISQFVAALEHYITQSTTQLAVTAEPFPEMPATYSPGAFFKPGEIIATLGDADDGLEFYFDSATFSYFRLIPRNRREKPISLAYLNGMANRLPLLRTVRGTVSTDINQYGAIGYNPAENPPQGKASIRSATQLFENGEVWGIGRSIIVTERGTRPDYVPMEAGKDRQAVFV